MSNIQQCKKCGKLYASEPIVNRCICGGLVREMKQVCRRCLKKEEVKTVERYCKVCTPIVLAAKHWNSHG